MSAEYGFSSLHIVESLRESDGEPGRELREKLNGKFSDFPISYHPVFDSKELFAVLNEIFKETQQGLVPILHFEVHGNPSGIQLRSKASVSWDELAVHFRQFNIATRFNLLVVMACCDGIYAIRALRHNDMCPFCAVVGCEGTIKTPELLNGYGKFYEILVNEGKALQAEAALQDAVRESRGTFFRFYPAERAFALVYADFYRKNRDPENRRKRLAYFRQVFNSMRALFQKKAATTETDVYAAMVRAERVVLRRFFSNFFAFKEVPENQTRYDFEAAVQRIEQQLTEERLTQET